LVAFGVRIGIHSCYARAAMFLWVASHPGWPGCEAKKLSIECAPCDNGVKRHGVVLGHAALLTRGVGMIEGFLLGTRREFLHRP